MGPRQAVRSIAAPLLIGAASASVENKGLPQRSRYRIKALLPMKMHHSGPLRDRHASNGQAKGSRCRLDC
ncbi:hypothetical protein EC9_48070 [Rosistilla ulvae]|uniref:Uncharacterized protein n=1 Tax=Rosistilla ulvae TaxID=1930277 RepID=A0A517M6U7_9BACT|nr:hypothetical protein EC9_48070 [Rosistilla ulvae]